MNIYKIDNKFINVDSITFIEVEENYTEIGFSKSSVIITRDITDDIDKICSRCDFILRLREGIYLNFKKVDYVEVDVFLKVYWKDSIYPKNILIDENCKDIILSNMEGIINDN